MTDIQQARDVLAKWREQTTVTMAESVRMLDFPLVVGTAGNPDLLDALDYSLVFALAWPDTVTRPSAFDKIAAAIIAADERMTS